MASRSLGVLTLDLVAKIGGYTAGLDKAEKEAVKRAAAIQNAFDTAATGVGVAFGLMSASAIAAFAAINKGIEVAASFQDIADQTGGSAEGFANFAVSAKVAGVEMETIASASTKLTKALVGVDDESKAAGAALSAIGISIEDFKNLRPDEQIEAVAKALGNFEEGAGKTAVAMDLFGKSGAEVVKFLKDYQENGGAVTILTNEQIKAADEYADANARARAQLELYASAAATQFLPVFTAVVNVAKDLIKEFLGVDGATKTLAQSTGVQTFVDNAVTVLGFLMDTIQTVARGFDILGTSIGAAAATAGALANGDFKAAANIQVEAAKDLYNKVVTIGDNLISTRIKKAIADQKALAAQARAENRGFNPNQQVLNYEGKTGRTPKGKKDNSAAQEAKAQLASDLSDIKAAQDAIVNTYTNAGKILEAERSAGLKDEQEYYAEKKRLLLSSNAAEQQGLEKTISRLQAENLSGKDAIENQRKIAESQAKLTKAKEDGATATKVLAIQEEAAYKKIASSLLAARQAAQDFFDTTNRGYERTLAAFGQGNKTRDMSSAIQQIEDRYQQQRQDLANRRSQAELQSGGSLTAAASKQFDDQLEIINEFQNKAIGSYQSYYTKLELAQKDWSLGATEALKNYADEAANTAKMTEDAFGNAFKGLEDALVKFVQTGKLDFKSLVDSILADIARIAIKQAVTGPLANALSGLIGGGGAASSSGGGDILGALISMNGWANGGYTGNGNPSEPAGIVHKGEYVLTAEQTRRLGVGNLNAGNIGSTSVNIQQNFAPGTDRRTTDQAARSAGLVAQRAIARNS